MRVAVQREKIKIVRVLERLLREIGLRRRQGAFKIGDGFAFAFVQLGFNVVRRAPPLATSHVRWSCGHTRGAESGWEIFSNSHTLCVPTGFLPQAVADFDRPILPQAVAESLNPNFQRAAGAFGFYQSKRGKRTASASQRCAAKTHPFWETAGVQVFRQLFDHLLAVAFGILRLDDDFPNVPIKQNQLAVDGNRRAQLRRADTRLEVGEQIGIATRKRGGRVAILLRWFLTNRWLSVFRFVIQNLCQSFCSRSRFSNDFGNFSDDAEIRRF